MCLSSSKGHVFQELSIDTKRMFIRGHLVHESVLYMYIVLTADLDQTV